MHLEAEIVEVRDALGGSNRPSLEVHLEALVERVSRCIWRPRSCRSAMYLEAEIEPVW